MTEEPDVSRPALQAYGQRVLGPERYVLNDGRYRYRPSKETHLKRNSIEQIIL